MLFIGLIKSGDVSEAIRVTQPGMIRRPFVLIIREWFPSRKLREVMINNAPSGRTDLTEIFIVQRRRPSLVDLCGGRNLSNLT